MNASFKRFRMLFAGKQQTDSTNPGDPDEISLLRSESELDEYMVRKKPFLIGRYSLYQLSDETGIPLSELTIILDRRHTPSFRDFIDSYRIAYCKDLLKRIPPRTVSLFDLSVICGFDDQQEFCAAFKKVSRISVTEYIRKVYRGRLSASRLGSLHFFFFLLVAITALHALKFISQPSAVPSPITNEKALPKEGRPIPPVMNGPVSNSFPRPAREALISLPKVYSADLPTGQH
jgi:AraC-like DNA-binding protein